MAFEMSLPHAARVQAVAADGGETVQQDEQQWDLYFTVQAALQQQQQQQGGDDGTADGGEKAAQAEGAGRQSSDPGKVLEKLMTARGELDVVTDLVTFLEQQQFLAVEGVHRPPPSLEERLRARGLRLAASRAALRGAGGLLARGLAALQAQSQVDNRFLDDLAQLRTRWKLRRHGGAAGLFYADISLPLRAAAARGVSQEGSHVNLLQDTNGDACVVEAAAPGGPRRAVRGWQRIHAVLERRQRALAWRVLQQVLAAQAAEPRHEADADGAVAALLRMAAAAAAACQAALHREVAASGGAAAPMEVDAAAAGGEGSAPATAAEATAPAAGAAGVAAAGGAAAGAAGAAAPMLGSMARDIAAVLEAPGFQEEFESRALLLLAGLLVGAGGGGGAAGQQRQGEEGVLDAALRWLRHAAVRHRVQGSLARWAAGGVGRRVRHIDTGEECTFACRLEGGGGPDSGAAPRTLALVIQTGDSVRVEGAGAAAAGAAAAAALAKRGLTRNELDSLLMAL